MDDKMIVERGVNYVLANSMSGVRWNIETMTLEEKSMFRRIGELLQELENKMTEIEQYINRTCSSDSPVTDANWLRLQMHNRAGDVHPEQLPVQPPVVDASSSRMTFVCDVCYTSGQRYYDFIFQTEVEEFMKRCLQNPDWAAMLDTILGMNCKLTVLEDFMHSIQLDFHSCPEDMEHAVTMQSDA